MVRGVPRILRLMGAGLRRPKRPVPGTDLAGVVESVGADVTWFRPGEEVFGKTVGANSWRNGGAYAEYASVGEDRLEPKPSAITFEQATAAPDSGTIAIQGLRDEGRLRRASMPSSTAPAAGSARSPCRSRRPSALK